MTDVTPSNDETPVDPTDSTSPIEPADATGSNEPTDSPEPTGLGGEVNRLVQAMQGGQLSERADLEQFAGSDQEVLAGINAMLDAVAEPFGVASTSLQRIGKGDIPSKVKDDLPGDFAAIRTGVNGYLDLTSAFTDEIGKLLFSAGEGKLEYRADVDRVSGVWQEILYGSNELLDTIFKPVRIAAEYIDQISRGEIPEKIERKFKGEFKAIKENLNQCIDAINTLYSNIATMAEAQRAGDVEARCDAENLQGMYAELARGINDAFDAIATPVVESIGLMNQYAAGDLSQRMRELPGKQIILTEGMNSIQANVQALIADAQMLADAAVEGQLEVRADVSKHQGDFRKVIDGVNDTMDAILAPIQEGVHVLAAVSQKDFSQAITSEYKGDHAQIRDSINAVVDAVSEAMSTVNRGANELNQGAKQIADASQSLSEDASRQAASLEQISASLEEMSGQTGENADNAREATTVAEEAMRSADRGQAEMTDMSQAMNEIKESSTEISKIIKVIDEIAFQTNLLALNAAVEAARAGEAGKGFAVVAEEVRNLAKRSADAAKDTSAIIEESAKRAENGVAISSRVGSSLEEIVTGAKKVNTLLSEISNASQEQADGINQLNSAVGDMDGVTQRNAGNAEELASASEESSSQVAALHGLVAEFRLRQDGLTGGRSQAAANMSRPAMTSANSGGSRSSLIPLDDDDDDCDEF